jgi:hypothetical protein
MAQEKTEDNFDEDCAELSALAGSSASEPDDKSGSASKDGAPGQRPVRRPDTRPCESCLERDHDSNGPRESLLDLVGLPHTTTLYTSQGWQFSSAAYGCSQCGGSGRVPADSEYYADLPLSARPVWDRPDTPRRRFKRYVPQSADLRLAQTEKQERFLMSLYRNPETTVKEAAEDAGLSERQGWKILAQLGRMSHLVQADCHIDVGGVLLGLRSHLTEQECNWLADVAEHKNGKKLAACWASATTLRANASHDSCER